MIHGSKVTLGQKGMRKGISLVEMLVAIILFGIIGTISYTYYKSYYDTSFAAKQIRVYTLIDQAAQLSNAFDLYNTKNSQDPTSVQDMVDDKIITEIPGQISFITTTGWVLDTAKDINTTDANGTAFTYAINNTDLLPADKVDYCNILNNTAYSESNLTRTSTEQNTSVQLYAFGAATPASEQEFFHCDANATATTFTFVKRPTKSE